MAVEARIAPLDLKAMMSSPVLLGLDVSPDGSSIVFSAMEEGPARVYVQPTSGGDRMALTDGLEGAVEPKWSPTGEWIAYLQDTGGDENFQVFVVSPDGRERRNLTNAADGIHENLAWSHDGTRIAYVSDRDGQFDVYYSDLDGIVHRVTNHPSVHHGPEFSPDGTHMSYASNRSQLPTNWDTFICSVQGGDERKITEHDGAADEMSYYANQSPRWSPDGSRILVASSVPGNYDLMAIEVETLERHWIARRSWDEGNGQWSPDGRRVAYTVNDDGSLVIYVQDLESGVSWPVSPPQGVSGAIGMRGKGGDYRWTRESRDIVYSHSGPDQPGSIWMVAAEGGEPRLLYSRGLEGVDTGRLVRPTLVHYPSFDGRMISGVLYLPHSSRRPLKALVMPHGGPTGQTKLAWSAVSQYLVSRGFALLAPNFRGSTGYGTEFQWLNRNDWGGGDLKDVVAGRDWLESEGIAKSIGITGGSYGGYLTLSAITQYPDKWDAAASIFGMANLVTAYETARPDMRAFQERNIGTPRQNPKLYQERSPVNYAADIRCPLLLLQGERDARVRKEETVQMAEAVRRQGKMFESVMYPDEGHGFVHLEHSVDCWSRVSDFFDQHLS